MKQILFLSVLVMFAWMSSCSNAEVNTGTAPQNDVKQNPLEQVSNAIAADSTNANLFIQRAQLYLNLGQTDKAFIDISTAMELDNRNLDVFLTLAEIYFVLGQSDNVNISLLKAVEVAPESPKPLVKLAELNMILENYDMALGYTDRAMALNSFNPDAYYVRGMIFLARKDTLSAIKNLQLALDQQDDFYDPMMQLGKVYAAQRNPLAELYLQKAVRTYPDLLQARYEMALYLQDNERWNDALLHYDTLLVASPENKYLYFNIGYVHMVYEGNFNKAIEYFDEALMIDPNYIDALYNKGRTLEEMGRYAGARDIYNEILNRETNYSLAVEGLNRLDRRR